MNSENVSYEKNPESEEYLDNKPISNGFALPSQDVQLERTNCDEKETYHIDYKNDSSKEPKDQLVTNQSEFNDDCKSSEEEVSNNNSSGPKFHIEEENMGQNDTSKEPTGQVITNQTEFHEECESPKEEVSNNTSSGPKIHIDKENMVKNDPTKEQIGQVITNQSEIHEDCKSSKDEVSNNNSSYPKIHIDKENMGKNYMSNEQTGQVITNQTEFHKECESPKEEVSNNNSSDSKIHIDKENMGKNDTSNEQTGEVITNQTEFHEICESPKEEVSNNNSLCPKIHIDKENIVKNDVIKEQIGQVITNQSEIHEDCKSSKEEISNNNSSYPKIHIDKENMGKNDTSNEQTGEVITNQTEFHEICESPKEEVSNNNSLFPKIHIDKENIIKNDVIKEQIGQVITNQSEIHEDCKTWKGKVSNNNSSDPKVHIYNDNMRKNYTSKEQTGQIITNQSEFHKYCKSSKEEVPELLSNNNGSCTKINIGKENMGKTEYLGGEIETEGIYVNHVEIENYDDQENLSLYSESESQVEDTLRLGTDSERAIYVDLEEYSEHPESLPEENSLGSNNSHKNKYATSDDSQYDVKHLLDIKEVKVLHECSLCPYSTTHLGILQKHISTKHRGRKIWKCKHCSKKFSSKDSLHKHIYKDHKKRTRKCPYCLCILVCSGKVMKSHISDMHSLERLPPVSTESNIPKMVGFTRKGPRGTYKCENCSYSNRCLNNMLGHAKLHTRKYVLKCLYCHYLTDQQNLYISHLSNAHKLAKHIHICSRCFYQSDSYIEYVEHRQHPHSYHSCEFCDFKTYSVEKFYFHVDNRECSKSNSDKNIENLEELDENSEHSETNETMEKQYSKIHGNGDVTEDKDEITNIQLDDFDYCLEVEKRRQAAGLRKYYTQSEVNNLRVLRCLKCDFMSKFNRHYEICEHIVSEHIVNPKNSESTLIKDTNVVEIVQVQSESSPANRYAIEPWSTNAKTQHDTKNNSSFTCQHCNWAASTLHQKIVHEQKMHDVTNFNCPTCSFESTDESALIDHFKNHPDSNRQILCCPFCELEVENETSLKSHVDIEHLNFIEECGEESNIKQELLDDDLPRSSDEATSATKEVEFDEVYQCDLCTFNAQDYVTFESHKKNHLICPRCSLDKFSNEEEFWAHVDHHCPQCHFCSNDLKKLKLHVLSHVPKYRRPKGEDSTTRWSKRLLDADTIPVENVTIITDDENETNSLGYVDELDEGNILGEEILIIFEDSLESDDSSELSSYDDEETEIIVKRNDQKFESPLKRRRIMKIDESSAGENSDVEAKKYKGKPVRIIKLVQFQCFDCLNIYKTRYTLVEHRKRMHGLKKPHSCTYCMEIFEAYRLLKSHYYRVHKASFHYRGPIFKCPLCEFNSRYLRKTSKHVENVHKKRVAGFHKGTVVQ